MERLLIRVPATYQSERAYILTVVLHQWLGLDFDMALKDDIGWVEISLSANNIKALRLNDNLFQTETQSWLKIQSLPVQPLPKWKVDVKEIRELLVTPDIPVIFGNLLKNSSYVDIEEDIIELGIDILGSAFFMLTRYEEYIEPERDLHDRFPASASLAYQEGFLDRPIINEYIEILWWCLNRLWPGLARKKRRFRTIVSHDIDVPFAQAFSSTTQLIRNCIGDIVRRRSLYLAMQRTQSWQAVKKGDYKQDLNYTFDRIMDISEINNLKSAFYFKTACTNKTYDNNYSIKHPYIRKLIKDIHNRGHEIGFHPSYETYLNWSRLKGEFDKLLEVCEQEGIQQSQWGGRQHYLRWRVPQTWRSWADIGLNYDSTLTYVEHAGFRCGVCYEYQTFDLEQSRPLSLFEYPLIIMDGSILEKQNMDLGGNEAVEYIMKLKRRCQQFQGQFTHLWHNNIFTDIKIWQTYEALLK
ncbi:MAG: polysaccharide deacetylase family protein [Syntrophomonadaceae bacterium]|nr:polysaccharide deacetylase family protein [Syntrophomonadaceae bacterium]